MQTWFLTRLRQAVGRRRALAVYVALYRWGGLGLSVLVLAALLAAAFVYIRPYPHRHVAYHLSELRSIVPWPSDSGAQSVILDARLPTGVPVRLAARSSRATGVLDTICVEERRFLASGRTWYRLATPEDCQP